MIVASVIKVRVPTDSNEVAVDLLILNEQTGHKSYGTLPALAVRELASLDRMPQVGDQFHLNLWRIIQ